MLNRVYSLDLDCEGVNDDDVDKLVDIAEKGINTALGIMKDTEAGNFFDIIDKGEQINIENPIHGIGTLIILYMLMGDNNV